MTRWFQGERVRSVGSQASAWDELVSRRMRQVDSQLSVWDQLVLRRDCATSWFSSVCV